MPTINCRKLRKKGKGFLPTISIVPKDHHSLLQLYLDGPRDKLFYVFSFEKKSKRLFVKNKGQEDYLNNKTLDDIKNAQKNALIKTFKKNNIPFREFKIKILMRKLLVYYFLILF